jgi:hypothetical protein
MRVLRAALVKLYPVSAPKPHKERPLPLPGPVVGEPAEGEAIASRPGTLGEQNRRARVSPVLHGATGNARKC